MRETLPEGNEMLTNADITAISEKLTEILDILEKHPERRAALSDTPGKIAGSWREIFAGIGRDPLAELKNKYRAVGADPVVLRDIAFASMCEHHFLPFFGAITIAYAPGELIAGFGAIIRVTEVLSRRPQIQERLTAEIADALNSALCPAGIAVRIEARHLCMSMIGTKKNGSSIVTLATRGEASGLLPLLG
jgi:GTP cyclohydrolase I